MSKFAVFDENGFPSAFYSEDVHGPRTLPIYGEGDEYAVPTVIGSVPNPDTKIPATAVEISDDHWTEFLVNAGRQRWDGVTIISFDPLSPPVSAGDVNAERLRRMLAGTAINGVHVTGSDDDARNLSNLMMLARMRLDAGDEATTTIYRDYNNVDHVLTPADLVALWQAATAYVSALYAASWSLKALDPIPADFADDSYWP